MFNPTTWPVKIVGAVQSWREDRWRFFYHMGCTLGLIAYTMTDILHLRVIAMVGNAASLMFFVSRKSPEFRDSLFWCVVFGMVNLLFLARAVLDHTIAVSPEQEAIYDDWLSGSRISLRQGMQLIRSAERRKVPAGAQIRAQGEFYTDLQLVIDGSAEARWSEGQCGFAESVCGWVGEMGYLDRLRRYDGTDDRQRQRRLRPATTQVVATTPCTVLVWSDQELRKVFEENPGLQGPLNGLLAGVAADRMASRMEDSQYESMLKGVLADGQVTQKAREIVSRYREQHGIDDVMHHRILKRAGWTPEEWVVGMKRDCQVDVVLRRLDQDRADSEVVSIQGYARAFGELSSYFPAQFRDDSGVVWPTAEHYFQAMKFEDDTAKHTIRSAQTALRARELGRGYDHPEWRLREDWDQTRETVLWDATRHKFAQSELCRSALLATGDRPIILKDCDSFWGTGVDGSGENKLGQVLMAVRSELRAGLLEIREPCTVSPAPWPLPGD
eukprot:TRINITY_DN3610_c1_g1_i1.p1 TRINITY_DN3610_c1_g1~~TRINITY_DN3610_c1_g1_i1.p1  ORF type:complete len:499 (+),score=48.67 TRINITY_DN3610_c1_g1_i1:442-1938(+)